MGEPLRAVTAHRAGIIGRGTELAAVVEFVRRAPGGGAGLLIEGEPGIGKTTLWREGVELAGGVPLRVLTCRPVEAESTFAFGGLIDLLGDAIDEPLLEELPEAQARALRIAFLRTDAGDAAVDPRLVGLAVLSALRLLSARESLLLAVDDLQWLEPSSARILAYVLHRLNGARIAVLASLRLPLDEGRGLFGLERWMAEEVVQHLRLGPLSLGALHQLVRERLGLVLTRPMAARLTRASGGNPFYALEIARLLRQQAVDVTDSGMALSIPRDLRQMVAGRITGLPEQAREAVLAAFALTRPTEELVEADLRLAGLPGDGIALAVRAQALELGGGRVELAHPLIGSAAYAELTRTQRRALHGRLAGLALDPEEQVRHLGLATAGPDAGVAAALDRAAERARARGAPEAAAELLELAVNLTSDADAEARLGRLDGSAIAYHVAGDSRKAVAQWEEIARTAPPGARRAHAMWRLAEYGSASVPGGFEAAPEQLLVAIEEAGADTRLLVDIEASLSEVLIWGRGPRAAEPHARTAVVLARRIGDRPALAHALVTQALAEFFLGSATASQRLEEAVEIEVQGLDLPAEIQPTAYRAYLATWAGDRLPEAAAMLEEKVGEALREHDEASLPVLLWHRCEVAVASGDLDAAESYAAWCRDAVEDSGRMGRRGAALYCQALVEAHRGRHDDALRLAEHALEIDEPRGVIYLIAQYKALLGFIELSAGRPQRALEWMEPLHQALLDAGYGDPSIFGYVPDMVEAMVSLGRMDDAAARLEAFDHTARALGRRSALAVAARSGGFMLAAAAQWEAALSELERAVRLEQELGRPFQQARALLTLGTVARRARLKAAADDALQRSAELFARLGAPGWEERARAERSRIGLRPPAPGGLTETERRIALLVAEGRSNPEIGHLLFMSRKTVEAHLTSLYRKLGIATRSELAAMAERLGAPPPPGQT